MVEAAIKQFNKKLKLLQRKLDANRNNRQNISISHMMGGLPESKHLDCNKYENWKFWMENFLFDAGL